MRGLVGIGAVALGLAVALGSCTGSDGGSPPGENRYLVLPEGTPGLAVGELVAPETGYASAVLRGDGTSTVAMVRGSVAPGSFEELTEGRASATLANGLEVFYVCGGRGVSGASLDDPTQATVIDVNGPLMVVARVDGDVLTVEDTPTDTGACTQPTSVQGPLVDVAASLEWVDEAEFRRLLAAHPPPERAATPTTG